MEYGFSKTTSLGYDEAIVKVTDELRKEGFGILTTIDVRETLKNKLGVDFSRYVILGACNPHFAHQALQAEENLGLLLPCNVIIYEKGAETFVALFDPMSMAKLIDHPALGRIAHEVKQKLERAFLAI